MSDSNRTGTLIVNLFGGPGTGKSTMAAGIFSELKWQGINCEIATEYAKEKVWEESFAIFENQVYVFAQQLQRIMRVKGKVDVVVTDSPLILTILYDKNLSENFDRLILEIFSSFENMNYFLERKKKYLRKGRRQTLEEAIELDKLTRELLDRNNLDYTTLLGERQSTDVIVKHILEWVDKKNSLNP